MACIHSLESYGEARAALIKEEKALRFDATKLANLSSVEAQAETKVRAIRDRERDTIWNEAHDESVFPGMNFLTAKNIIEDTSLFKLLKKMPKGAILHGHFDAMNTARFVLSEAYKYDEIHIRASVPLTSAAAFTSSYTPLPVQFSAQPASFKVTSDISIFSPEYKADEWVPIKKARDEYPEGGQAFDDIIVSLLSIQPGEAYDAFNTAAKIWTKFGSTFQLCHGIISYEPIYRAYLKQVFLGCIEDGVSYIETRINFFYPTYVRAGTCINDLTHLEMVGIYQEVLKELKDELRAAGRGEEFWGAKIIYTTLRFIDNDALLAAMEDCIELKKAFPDLICGFDLVAHEDPFNPLAYYLPSLLNFQKRQQEEGVEIPFVFHAGETLGDGDKVDHNLFDAILLGTKRIGHGFSLAKHPLLMQKCKEQGICIEMCPISNELLRYTSSILSHPIQILLNSDVKVVLSCDDPQIFNNMGLTYDFFQVLAASEATGLISMGVLARQSIEYSLMETDMKQNALRIWDKEWLKFCEWVLD